MSLDDDLTKVFETQMAIMYRAVADTYGDLFAHRCGLGTTVDRYDHWNSAEVLPPVDCPLVIDLGKHYGVRTYAALASRTTHLSQRDGQMEYRLSSGQLITGRFQWTYP